MSYSSAVMLGGPGHGDRLAIPGGTSYWCTPVMSPLIWDSFGRTANSNIETVRADVISIPVGARKAHAVVWPDIKRVVAEALLSDYIMAAWAKYDITHGAKRR